MFKIIVKNKKIFFLFFIFCIIISPILLNSSHELYKKLKNSKFKLFRDWGGASHDSNIFSVNNLEQSKKQAPPTKITDLKIEENANLKGQWSAPVDWNVVTLHSILLPDYSVMTYGTFAIQSKEDGDIRANKKITLTDGVQLDRDGGDHQWMHHDTAAGIHIDIWNPEKGFGDKAHKLFKTPVLMDAFCSITRVLDLNRVFILGGGQIYRETPGDMFRKKYPDTQYSTTIYNIKEQKFEESKNLNFPRWYGSVIITGDNKMIMMGGKDIGNSKSSIIPEITDLNNLKDGWRLLKKAESEEFFGIHESEEWNYPRAYLSSDGNVIGISYNKTWVMDKSDDYRINRTGEIPLVKGGISKIYEEKNPNNPDDVKKLRLLTIGSAVGPSNSTVMIDNDKVLVFGGKQKGDEYSSSNKVFSIDFSNNFKPKIKELENMLHPRSYGNATILPGGEIFLNGGSAYNDKVFSNYVAEIYDPKTEISEETSESYFRRNYHSSSLLLPDGSILTGGGDAWNAEIFYPPYLFTKDSNNQTVLAKRTEILNLDKSIKRGDAMTLNLSEDDVYKVTLISTGSTTHSQGSEPKFRNLNFKKLQKNKIQVILPENANEIQDGTYLIFVLNSKGVPSHGKIVYIN
tara:strand:- start:432 stop:2318 length:1887 start_codon:yes stop_codon:yes gene_type:complete